MRGLWLRRALTALHGVARSVCGSEAPALDKLPVALREQCDKAAGATGAVVESAPPPRHSSSSGAAELTVSS